MIIDMSCCLEKDIHATAKLPHAVAAFIKTFLIIFDSAHLLKFSMLIWAKAS